MNKKFDPENPSPLTKVETVALWYAVMNFDLMVREMRRSSNDFGLAVISSESLRLQQAKRALRKVNNLRKQGL